MANAFFIGGTNFGIDAARSQFKLTKSSARRSLLSVEIVGDQATYVRLSEEGPWSFTLYPPKFYLRGYALPPFAHGEVRTVEMTAEDVDDVDIAIYLMAHNEVDSVTLVVGKDRIEISGRVDVMGKVHAFRIEYARRR